MFRSSGPLTDIKLMPLSLAIACMHEEVIIGSQPLNTVRSQHSVKQADGYRDHVLKGHMVWGNPQWTSLSAYTVQLVYTVQLLTGPRNVKQAHLVANKLLGN